jgi:hypothetical protein
MSKKYLYIRRQSGGCDYTIGCGISIQEIHASSREDAIQKIINIPDDWQDQFQEHNNNIEDYSHAYISDSGLIDVRNDKYDEGISGATLIEISDEIEMLPILSAKLDEMKAVISEIKNKAHEDDERKLYEKLQKKFNK